MFYRRPCLTLLLALPVACGEPSDTAQAPDDVDVIRGQHAALDACNESVPDTRKIDGIPAYAQCASIENGAIFSNNGIDTSATKMGSDWVQTQYSGGYQCTELAHRYLAFKWKVNWIPNGNAGEWCNTQPPASSGVVQSSSPVHGDLMVFAPGSCGADGTYGHVAVVDVVDATKAKVTAVEQNLAQRSPHNTTCAKCFLHVVANDGTNKGATIGSGAAGDGGTSKPVAVADAGSPSAPSQRDAGKDSSTHAAPPSVPSDDSTDDSADEPTASTSNKADAGARKDAGAKSGKANDVSDAHVVLPTDDEEDPASNAGAAGGCSLAASTSPGGTAPSWLLALGLVVIARRGRNRREQPRRRELS